MSKRNTRAGKARRRRQREVSELSVRKSPLRGVNLTPESDITSIGELVELAERGETLPCGCDAHAMLHDALAVQAGHLPDGWQRF